MKTMKPLSFAWALAACVVLCGSVAASPLTAALPVFQDGIPPDSLTALADASSIRINEMLPNPTSGRQWVELYRPWTPDHFTYLPLLMRDAGAAASSTVLPARDPVNTPGDPDISGWQVTNKAGQSYTIPDELPPVPPGAFVVILFSGGGPASNDYDFSDRLAVLYTPPGMVNTFDPAADQVALYTGATHNAATIRDYVAYGAAPGAGASDAIAAGLWKSGWWVGLQIGSGATPAGETPPANRSIGLYPGHTNLSPDDWAAYTVPDITLGAANPVPRSTWSTTADGAVMASDGFALGWMLVPGATYRLQIDDDAGFGTPLIDVALPQPYYQPQTPFPAGSYWWRVRAILSQGQSAAWSAPAHVTVVPVAGFAAASDTAEAVTIASEKVLTMTWLRQRKDNRLLCLDGDNEGNPATYSTEVAWDEVHPDGIYTHGRNSCVRASIAMIVTHYGGNLSMDRIGYYQFENWGAPLADIGEKNNPLRDLGHDRTTSVCGGDGSHGGQMLAWALGINISDYTYDYAKPSFGQVQGWIDASRPIMRYDSGHQTVIGGYRTLAGGIEQVRLFDPWSGTTWQDYGSLAITCYYVPPVPASVTAVRSDEPGIWTDADSDGVMDWDEQNRFHTVAAYADSDDDWVRDKQDLREYVFDTAGVYSLRTADYDSDTKRKELDADNDNDNDGAVDGCEDIDRDGKYEAASGETNNFNAASHQACTPVFDILQPTETNPVNAGAHDAPDKILVQVKTATPPSSPVTYTAGDFTVYIGGVEGTVVAAYRSLDTHFLVVSAPAQPTADYYDLEVTLGSQTAKETRAVFYLPKLNADQVLVIDRSGSMADYDKLDAAKNAARAFIDHTNVDDMIGVVSFSQHAAVNYPLTMVTGDTEWNAAKAAVDALTPTTTTALGEGAQLGYNEVITGKEDHDWSLALLSDGMENESPYWADPTVSGVIVPSRVVVHTVALGRDADTALLGKIAADTDGRAFQAGVDILPAPAATELSANQAPTAVPGPNLPTTLPNRLADIYKAIGEVNGHQQRVWESTGPICEQPAVLEVPVEKGLPEAIFTVNWDDPTIYVDMTLTDPNGKPVTHNPPDVREIRDATHHQFRVQAPLGGVWVVHLQAKGCGNYLFILSARSLTGMHLGFGLPPEERTVGAEIPILVVLADAQPIAGATVVALVQGPNVEITETVPLYDDGGHEDGKADDGVYGGLFKSTKAPGQYLVKATAWGDNNDGESFVRHRTGGFAVLPRVAYIWQSDLPTAVGYRDLLQADGYSVNFVPMADVATTNWSRYNLIIIGPDTGTMADWGTPAAVGALLQYSTPILGLGEGGYAFFGKAGLGIGHPNGHHGSVAATYKVNSALDVWRSPYAILTPRDLIVQVYEKTAHVGIYVAPPTGMLLIGREPADQTHYNLIEQDVRERRFLLWGFQAGPRYMTGDGRHLLVNVARYLAGM